ncbi:hypothetical protein GQ53DRAFT_839320 [Thozetella sp. PMI_491]|nr:hypothetical protein GQ53DRAFT_839320 [Thozetella sp. PMI_491]
MSGYKDILKKGWHPEKEGSTFKGQMKSLVGRGDKNERHSDHVAAPLSSLRDPASFGPPPKQVHTGAAIAPLPAPSRSSQSPTSGVPKGHPAVPSPAQHGYGQPAELDEAPAPPKPYRMDTTGLSTAHLPPPPGRKDGADGRNLALAAPPLPPVTGTPRPTPPGLPPRLPPRAGAGSPSANTGMPTAASSLPGRSATSGGTGVLSQGAVHRLGAAGISVPAFGIGKSSTPPPTAPISPVGSGASMNELQSRFSKLGNSSGPEKAPTEGTTFAQKQAAFKTATAFRQDPRSVSLSDAKAAASTANNFRQRHGAQVAAGLQEAQGANEKYGMLDKMGSYAGGSGASTAPTAAALLGKKKPAPPPPKKRPDLASHSAENPGDGPPPVPMGTRPQF